MTDPLLLHHSTQTRTTQNAAPRFLSHTCFESSQQAKHQHRAMSTEGGGSRSLRIVTWNIGLRGLRQICSTHLANKMTREDSHGVSRKTSYGSLSNLLDALNADIVCLQVRLDTVTVRTLEFHGFLLSDRKFVKWYQCFRFFDFAKNGRVSKVCKRCCGSVLLATLVSKRIILSHNHLITILYPLRMIGLNYVCPSFYLSNPPLSDLWVRRESGIHLFHRVFLLYVHSFQSFNVAGCSSTWFFLWIRIDNLEKSFFDGLGIGVLLTVLASVRHVLTEAKGKLADDFHKILDPLTCHHARFHQYGMIYGAHFTLLLGLEMKLKK